MRVFGAILVAVAMAAPGVALAQRYREPPASYYEPHDPCPAGYSLQQQDRAAYDCSGTRGRMGLGASPYHPEGPGNFSLGR